MLWGSTATTTDIGSTSLYQLWCPGAKILWPHREDGFAFYQLRHPRIWLYTNRLGSVLGNNFYNRHQLFRAKRTVNTNNICPHSIQGYSGSLRISTCNGTAILAIGQLTNHWQLSRILSRQKSCPHFLNINKGFYQYIICTC